MMGFGGIIGILLIGLIVWAVIQFSSNNKSANPFNLSQQKSDTESENALDILKKRYARGEISLEEYEQMKKKI